MAAPETYVYLLEGLPLYDTGSGLETREVYFFSGPPGVDGLLSSGDKAHIGLSQQLSARVSIDHPLIGGNSAASTTFGEIVIAWGGGDHDAKFHPPYYWRGNQVEIARIPMSLWPDAGSWQPLFTGLVEDLHYDKDRVRLVVRDRSLSLDRRLQPNVYLGTGTTLFGGPVEGPASLTDVPKPVMLGTCTNVEPVSVDRPLNLYQFHDGDHSPAEAVSAVYDKGVELDPCGDGDGDGGNTGSSTTGLEDFSSLGGLLSWAPVLGEYATHLAGGFVRMGGTPDGRVTIDAQGDAESNTAGTAFSDLWHILVRRVAVGYAGLTTGEMSSGIASAGYTHKVGFYSGTNPVLCSEVIRQLAESGFGFAAFSRRSILGVGRFAIGTPAATIREHQILEIRVDRTPMPADPVRIGYQRAWTVQSHDDLAAGTDDARRDIVTSEYRYLQTSTGVVDYYPEAKSRTFDTLLSNSGDASEVLLLTLVMQYGGYRRIFVRCRDHTLAIDVGTTVTLEHSRFGLSAGLDGIVLAVTDNLSNDETQVLLLVNNVL